MNEITVCGAKKGSSFGKVGHFGLQVGDVHVAYLYIRKNGCSAWKRLFMEKSPERCRQHEFASSNQFMQRLHRLRNLDSIAAVPHRVVVFRDPIDRVVSGFLNQLVMRFEHGSRPLENVGRALNKEPGDVCFQEFIEEYVLQEKESDLNPHFLRQSSHLAPIEYNHVWPLDNLEECAARLFGECVAYQYFGKKQNATGGVPRYEEFSGGMPIKRMHRTYRSEGKLPSRDALIQGDLMYRLKIYYARDLSLMDHARRTWARSA